MTRRDALKPGTGTALSAAIGHSATATGRNTATPNSGDDICFMRAVDMVDAIRTRKLSAREVMQRTEPSALGKRFIRCCRVRH